MDYKEEYEKILKYYRILNLWLAENQAGKSIVPYLRENGYFQIAVYGMKELGERLYDEIKNTEISISYVIDRNPAILGDFSIFAPENELPPVDLIVVTADYYFGEIFPMLRQKVDCPIVSIGTLLGKAFGVWL